MNKKVYVGLSIDLIHTGHLNIINEAKKYGDVIVGVLTDKAIASYKALPYLPFEDRKKIAENIKGVTKVIDQETLDYVPNLRKIKPDYVVHGDDWKTGIQSKTREKVIAALIEWGGELIEPDYTKHISSSMLRKSIREIGTTAELRQRRLRRLIEHNDIVRVMEAHNGLSGLIIEHTMIETTRRKEFDAIWVSSLTDSTAKGKPDTEYVDFTSRLNTINEILDATTKPIIVDGDTGGILEHFPMTVKTLERTGVSAIIIEDKVGLKKNSLFGTDANQQQDSVEGFSEKIHAGKHAQVSTDFMIIARIESLILKAGMEDALKRAKAYIAAGADAIMIHSKEKTPDEILEFCKAYAEFENKVPLVAVPSTYSSITEDELSKAGVTVVIYANHLLRSAYPAMLKTATRILESGRAFEAEELCMPIKEILELIPGTK
ncbi:MAG: phosphoenolpyruvate mutase [Nanoarchaeota archaeon]|nr:phosphoenolpyruvate mutase [Nanoarchaeota archaeon]